MQPTPSPSDWATQLAPLAQQWPFLPALLLGLGLAATSGLRAFLPLLALAAAFRFGAFGLQPTGNFAWLGSDFATVVEVAGDKIPVVDHVLDSVGTLVRPAAGALAAGAVLNSNDPATGALIGLVVGAPLALGVHGAKATSRGASTVGTFGMANPLVSAIEDVVAIFVLVAAFFIPALIPLVLLVAVWLVWKIYRSFRGEERKARRRRRSKRAHAR